MECHLARITVHCESLGDGRPLAIVPGWPDDWRVPADHLEPVFADRPGWRRIYLDLPGRGETKGEPWITSNDQILDIVLEVRDRVIPREPFTLVGPSAGAYLSRAVLHRLAERVDGLLQVVPEIGTAHADLPERVTLVSDEALMARIGDELGRENASLFTKNLVVQTPVVYERFKALLPAIHSGDAAFLDRLVDVISFRVDPPPTPFRRPALFVLGRQDAVVGFRGVFELMDAYPRASVAILDRAGHALPWEQEGVFRALVAERLSRVESEATE